MAHDVENPDAQDLPTLGRLENLLNDNLEVKSDEEWEAEAAAAKKKGAGKKDFESEEAGEEGDTADSETVDEDAAGEDDAGDEGDKDDADKESEVEDDETEADEEQAAAPRSLRDLAEKLGMEYSELLENISADTKIDGEAGSATLAQLIKGYQLEGHLNRKLQDAAEHRKELEAQYGEAAQAINAQAAELEQGLQVAAALLQGEFASIDWASLQQENPQQFLMAKNNFEERKNAIVQVFEKLQQSRQHNQHVAAEQYQQAIADHMADQKQKLLNVLPAWSDEATGKAERDAIRNYLMSDQYGYTEDQAKQISDFRWVVLARKAMLYDKAQEKANVQAKKVRQAPKLGKPGTSKRTDAKTAKYKQERAKVRKTGRMSVELLDSMGLLD